MKKLLFILIAIFITSTSVNAQGFANFKYKIVGKGSSGQEACSGTISGSGLVYGSIKINIPGEFSQSYGYESSKRIDSKNKIYQGSRPSRDFDTGWEDIHVQICSNNPNVRFVVIQHYTKRGLTGQEIYKTVVEYEND